MSSTTIDSPNMTQMDEADEAALLTEYGDAAWEDLEQCMAAQAELEPANATLSWNAEEQAAVASVLASRRYWDATTGARAPRRNAGELVTWDGLGLWGVKSDESTSNSHRLTMKVAVLDDESQRAALDSTLGLGQTDLLEDVELGEEDVALLSDLHQLSLAAANAERSAHEAAVILEDVRCEGARRSEERRQLMLQLQAENDAAQAQLAAALQQQDREVEAAYEARCALTTRLRDRGLLNTERLPDLPASSQPIDVDEVLRPYISAAEAIVLKVTAGEDDSGKAAPADVLRQERESLAQQQQEEDDAATSAESSATELSITQVCDTTTMNAELPSLEAELRIIEERHAERAALDKAALEPVPVAELAQLAEAMGLRRPLSPGERYREVTQRHATAAAASRVDPNAAPASLSRQIPAEVRKKLAPVADLIPTTATLERVMTQTIAPPPHPTDFPTPAQPTAAPPSIKRAFAGSSHNVVAAAGTTASVDRMMVLNNRKALRRKREMLERRRMGDIDTEQQAAEWARQQAYADATQGLVKCASDESSERQVCAAIEDAERSDLATKERRQRTTILQWLAHRAAQVAARGLAELSLVEESERTALRDVESADWIELRNSAVAAKQAVDTVVTQRLAMEAAAVEAYRSRLAAVDKQRAERYSLLEGDAIEALVKHAAANLFGVAGRDEGGFATSPQARLQSILQLCDTSASSAFAGSRQYAAPAETQPWTQVLGGAHTLREESRQALAELALCWASDPSLPSRIGTIKEQVRTLNSVAGAALTSAPVSARGTPPATPPIAGPQLDALVRGSVPTGQSLSIAKIMRHHPHFSPNAMDALEAETNRLLQGGRRLPRDRRASALASNSAGISVSSLVPRAAAALVARCGKIFRCVAVDLEELESVDFADLIGVNAPTDDDRLAAKNVVRLALQSATESLRLNGNQLRMIASDARLIAAAFPRLRELEVRDNGARTLFGVSVAGATLPRLVSLDISANRVGSLAAVAASFPGLVLLKAIRCDLAGAGNADTGVVVPSMPASFSRLCSLEAQRNELEWSHIAAAVKACACTLIVVDLSHNKLGCLVGDGTVADRSVFPSLASIDRFYANKNGIQGVLFPADMAPTFASVRAVVGSSATLSQLFLQENQITAFVGVTPSLPNQHVASRFLFAPLLTVLSLSENKLVTIVGIEACCNLETLDVSFNALENRDELHRVLGGLKRLRRLSINDNPCVRVPQDAEQTKLFALSALPLLRNFNTDACDAATRSNALTSFVQQSPILQTQVALCALRASSGSQIFSLPKSAGDPVRLRLSFRRVSEMVAANAACDAAAVRFDAFVARRVAASESESTGTTRLQRLAKEREDQFVSWYRQAATEQPPLGDIDDENGGGGATASAFTRRSKVLQSVAALPMPFEVAADGLARRAASAAAWQEQMRDVCVTARKEGCHPGALPCMQNVVCVSSAYQAAQLQHRRSAAAKRLLKWMRFAVNRYRLLKAMRTMIQASAEGRRKRFEAAARKIQPVWRGKWTRMRLKRAQQPLDDWDEALFAKRFDIDAELEDAERFVIARPGAAQLVRSVAQSNKTSSTKLFELPPEPRPPFEPRPSSTSGILARPSMMAAAATAQQQRPSSMPLSGSSGGVARTPTGRSMQPAPALEVVSSEPPSQEESEWGDVTAQLRKRDAKRQVDKRRQETLSRLRR